MYKGKLVVYQSNKMFEFNIGSDNELMMVKIGKGTTKAERDGILDLIQEFEDIFSCTYHDIKSYRGDFIQHNPLIEGVKPFRQKLRHINPKLAPLIQKELQKMVDIGIIAPIRYSSWIYNLVVFRKNNGDNRLCVEFRNLNQLSLKENYPLPKHGTSITKSHWHCNDVYVGCFCRIQPSFS
jgi:hypothetical protein